MSTRALLITWGVLAVSIALIANAYTSEPLLDFSPGHVTIAVVLALPITAVIFVLLESAWLLCRCIKWLRQKAGTN